MGEGPDSFLESVVRKVCARISTGESPDMPPNTPSDTPDSATGLTSAATGEEKMKYVSLRYEPLDSYVCSSMGCSGDHL